MQLSQWMSGLGCLIIIIVVSSGQASATDDAAVITTPEASTVPSVTLEGSASTVAALADAKTVPTITPVAPIVIGRDPASIDKANAAVQRQQFPPQLPDTGYLMPLYDVLMAEVFCSKATTQEKLGLAADKCAQNVIENLISQCNLVMREKVPRSDSVETADRPKYLTFVAMYQNCLQGALNKTAASATVDAAAVP